MTNHYVRETPDGADVLNRISVTISALVCTCYEVSTAQQIANALNAQAQPAECNECKATPCAVLADQEPLCLEVGNYYGMLLIRCKAGTPEWCVENYSGCHWNPCPRPVYDALLAAAN